MKISLFLKRISLFFYVYNKITEQRRQNNKTVKKHPPKKGPTKFLQSKMTKFITHTRT